MAFKTKAQMTAYNKTYYAAHREENKTRCAKYHKTHRDELLAYMRAYYESHRPDDMPVWGSEDDKKNRRVAAKKALSKPATKDRLSSAIIRSWWNADHRERRSTAINKVFATPEHRAKMSASMKLVCSRPEVKAHRSEINRGENHPNWQGGLSFEPYCPKFDDDLRQRIRAFFGYHCIACGKSQQENVTKTGRSFKLHCHHVEYNKHACCDGEPVHFAALCNKHHAQTGRDRARWEAMLHRIIDEIYDGRSYYTKEEYIQLCGEDNNGSN